jgi:hypothetical protein
MADHTRRHVDTTRFLCLFCAHVIAGNKTSRVVDHINTHSDTTNNLCLECGHTNTSYFAGHKHVLKHSDVASRLCLQCAHTALTPYHLVKHSFTHSDVATRLCLLCAHTASSGGNLVKHSFTHSDVATRLCLLCAHTASSGGNLDSHSFTHSDVATRLCLVCAHTASTRGQLYSHSFTHSDVATRLCLVCAHTASTRGQLYSHSFTHSDVATRLCLVCAHTASTRGQLYSHSFTHSDVATRLCLVCAHTASSGGNLDSHCFTHSDVATRLCLVCAHTALTSGGLAYHVNQFFCKRSTCSFANFGPCADGERLMLLGHPENEKACYNHVGILYDPQHTLTHVLWPPVIPSTENSFYAFSRPIDSNLLPQPVLLDVETDGKFMLRAPLMCEKNPHPNTVLPFTLATFFLAIQPLVDALVTDIPDGIDVDQLIGNVVGQAFGDADARSGTKVVFHHQDVNGMNFYKHYVIMMNGNDDDIHLSYSEGCISVKLIGRPGRIINEVLTRLQYYAAYKYFPLSLIDVFSANLA